MHFLFSTVLAGCQRQSTTVADVSMPSQLVSHTCIADRGKTFDGAPQTQNFRRDKPTSLQLGEDMADIVSGLNLQAAYVKNGWFKGIPLNNSLTLTKSMMQSTVQSLQGLLQKERSMRDSLLLSSFDFQRLSGNDSLGNVLFTGYFTPVLQVKSEKDSVHQYPFYKKPERRGFPLPDRREIDFQDALAGKKLELAWSNNLFDNFVLQVQGSGIVEFENGNKKILAYGGKNGHPYSSIGKHLIELGEIARENISLSAIREWLEAHPERMREILSVNESYVFFRLAPPVVKGAASVPLTPHYSAAVDTDIIPLGSTLLAEVPLLDKDGKLAGHEYRILLAQDRGGAIKGTGRIDLYCGIGDKGMEAANSLNHYGRIWLITPKSTK